MIFVAKNVSSMIFKGRILGSEGNFLGVPYLNGTIVPFDYLNLLLSKNFLT